MCLMCEMEALYFAQLAGEQELAEQQAAEQERLAGEDAPQPPAPAPGKRDAFTCDEPKKAE